jgi:hypothetical protein
MMTLSSYGSFKELPFIPLECWFTSCFHTAPTKFFTPVFLPTCHVTAHTLMVPMRWLLFQAQLVVTMGCYFAATTLWLLFFL